VCLALPEAERTLSGRHAGFRVRGRTFAYYLVDHRGNEGIEGLVCKVRPGENEALIASDPERAEAPRGSRPRRRLSPLSFTFTRYACISEQESLSRALPRLARAVADGPTP
jgi:hypothetical protein